MNVSLLIFANRDVRLVCLLSDVYHEHKVDIWGSRLQCNSRENISQRTDEGQILH